MRGKAALISNCAGLKFGWPLSPHPGPLPWGEGETRTAARYWNASGGSEVQCAKFHLGEIFFLFGREEELTV